MRLVDGCDLIQPLVAPSGGGAPPRRVLLITYQYPPVGGAGVQRVTKFAKYLGDFGWTPTVLTVSNPSVPLTDASLCDDVPPAVVVRRAGTWEPGYALKRVVMTGGDRRRVGLVGHAKKFARRVLNFVLQPDPQVLWLPNALRAGRRILRENSHAAIVVSGPPFSTFLTAALLSRWSRLPLVLDYRDEWELANQYFENKGHGAVSRFVQRRMQRWVLRSAAGVVATTEASARTLEQRLAEAGNSAPARCIYNGYDAQDFADLCADDDHNGLFRLVYIGTLWNLTDVGPLVEGVRRVAADQPALIKRLELVFAGRRTESQQEKLAGLQGLGCHVVELPYIEHKDAVELMRSADALCVLLAGVGGAERVVPAKLFEYLAARREILAIGPAGEMGSLLASHPAAQMCHPEDVAGIASMLTRSLTRHAAGQAVDLAGFDPGRYERRRQTGELVALLNALVEPVGALAYAT